MIGVPSPADAMKLDGTTEAALARSLSALPPDERGWITDDDGRKNIESFAAHHRAEERLYFVKRNS